MSIITFIPTNLKPANAVPTRETVQKILDENTQLLQVITEYQLRGKLIDCLEYQKVLHRNLVYLAHLADSNTDVHASMSLQMLGNQMESGPLDHAHVLQVQPPGQGQIDNQYVQQQKKLSQQEQSMMGQESQMFQNNPMTLMSQSGLGQISQSSTGQNTNPAVQHHQPLMARNQPVMSQNPSDMSQNSNSVIMSGGSNHMMITHSRNQQSGYCNTQSGSQYSNQQGPMQPQLFTEQQQPMQSQYSLSEPASYPQQVPYMTNQQN